MRARAVRAAPLPPQAPPARHEPPPGTGHQGFGRKRTQGQSPSFLPHLLPHIPDQGAGREDPTGHASGSGYTPSGQRPWRQGSPGSDTPLGLGPQHAACLWDRPSRQAARTPAESHRPSSLFPEASVSGYKTWSFEAPALITDSDLSFGFRANSWAKWPSPKPISCLAGYRMFFPSK